MTDIDWTFTFSHGAIVDESTEMDELGRIVWTGVNGQLLNEDLQDKELNGVNLSGADLRVVNLSGATLNNSSLLQATSEVLPSILVARGALTFGKHRSTKQQISTITKD